MFSLSFRVPAAVFVLVSAFVSVFCRRREWFSVAGESVQLRFSPSFKYQFVQLVKQKKKVSVSVFALEFGFSVFQFSPSFSAPFQLIFSLVVCQFSVFWNSTLCFSALPWQSLCELWVSFPLVGRKKVPSGQRTAKSSVEETLALGERLVPLEI